MLLVFYFGSTDFLKLPTRQMSSVHNSTEVATSNSIPADAHKVVADVLIGITDSSVMIAKIVVGVCDVPVAVVRDAPVAVVRDAPVALVRDAPVVVFDILTIITNMPTVVTGVPVVQVKRGRATSDI